MVNDTTTEWLVSPILLTSEAVSVAVLVIDSRYAICKGP